MRFEGSVQVVEAEIVGILKALLWLEELQIGNVVVTIENNSLLSVYAVNKKNEN